MKKRILSMLLVIVMILGVLPTIALADEAPAKSIVIDFKESAKKAAEQDFWANLKDAAGAKYTTKYVGYKGKVAMTADQTAAYNSLRDYLWENHGWTIDESTSHLTTYQSNKGVWFNANDMAETEDWGITYLSGGFNTAADLGRDGSYLHLTVYVDEAGYYSVNTTAYYSTSGGKLAQYTDCGNSGVGGAYADVLVNGVSVLPEGTTAYGFSGHGDNAAWANTTQTDEIGTAYFKAGANTVSINTVGNWENVTASGAMRRNISLKAMELVKVGENDCAHETVEAHYCTKCGELADGHYLIDFKAFAADAAEQDWFADLYPAATVAGAWAGYFTAAMTADEAAAYDSMIEFMKDNYGWYLDESATKLKTTAKKKGFWMSPDNAAPWGVSFFSTYLESATSDFTFKMDVAEEGVYAIDMTGYYEGTTGAVKINQFTGGGDAGSGYVDILINGKNVLDDHNMNGQGQTYQNLLQTQNFYAKLVEGENTITIRPAKDLNGIGSSHRRYVAFKSFGFELLGECPHDYVDGACSICGNLQLNDEGIFEIGSEAALLAFSAAVANGNADLDAVLVDNVELTVEWIKNNGTNHAIGTVEAPYAGTFDGAGYTISGLNSAFNNNYSVLGDVNGSDVTRDFRIGLFGTTNGAAIKNLTVEGTVTMSGRQSNVCSVAGLVANASNTTIENCFNKVALTGKSSGGWNAFQNVGGLVGYADTVTITKSGNEVDLLVDGRNMGGLVGTIAISEEPTVISDCYNLGDLDGVSNIGGLVGMVGGCTTEETPTTITNCYTYGDVDSHHTVVVDGAAAVVYDTCYCGGMFGTAEASTEEYTLYTSISNLFVSASTKTTIAEGMKTAIARSWPGNSSPARENIWAEAGEGKLEIYDYNDWGLMASSEDLANADFVRTMGGNLVLIDGDTLPKLAWQHEHAPYEGYVYNSNLTHTASTLCEGCSYAVATAEPDYCIDADDNNICDVCANEMICKHLKLTAKYEAKEDGTHDVLMFCVFCEELQSSENVACSDSEEDDDVVCDFCEAAIPCKHAETTTSYVDNANGTHDVVVTCDACNEEISTETADCADEDEDGYCDLCEGVIASEPECDHSNTNSETVSNGDKTHTTTVTCECGEVVSTETADCVDADKDTKCDVCGAVIYTIKKVNVASYNMTLGNELKLNFVVKKSDVGSETYTAKIYHEGKETIEVELAEYNTSYMFVTRGVAAKEMTDVLAVEIYDANGYLVSEPYGKSVKDYAEAMLGRTTDAKMKTLLVDMLNYGAEAQKFFSYNADALANANLTDEQKACASATVEVTNNQVKGTNYAGTVLSLEDSILLSIVFNGIKNSNVDGLTATVEFVNYRGNTITGDAVVTAQTATRARATVNQIVLADSKCLVTVKLYKDGNLVGEGSDSVESYAARSLAAGANTVALNDTIMKFSTSAKAYLLK